jgi:hypothetical protein
MAGVGMARLTHTEGKATGKFVEPIRLAADGDKLVPLGFRQEQVLRLWKNFSAEYGRSPTYGVIRNELGIEKGNISSIVVSLRLRGLLPMQGNNL